MFDENGNGNGGRNRRFEVREGGGPDNPLDELLETLKRTFGGGGGGGGRGGRGGNPFGGDNSKLFVGIGAIVVVLAGILTSFYTVDVEEQAVVVRFGQYLKTSEPGLHFKLPFGVDRVEKVPSKVILQEEFGFRSTGRDGLRTNYSKSTFDAESLMLTGDLNVADVEWIVQYRIDDPWKFLYHSRNVRRTIRDVSMSIMRRVVGDRLVGDVLTVGRVEIADQAKLLTQEVLDQYDIGIRIEAVMLQDVNPPDPVKPAFNEVNAAKQEQEKAINQAEREYNNVIPEARGKAEQKIAEARAFAIDVINRAKGDASKFSQILTEYRKAPQVTRKRMYLETMEKVFSRLDGVTIVDSKIKGIMPLFDGGALNMKKAE